MQKILWRNSKHFHFKNSRESRNRRNISLHDKGYIWQNHSQQTFKWRNLKIIQLKTEMRQGCSLSPLLYTIVLKALAGAIRQEKEIEGIQIWKEEDKLTQLANDKLLYIRGTQNSTRNLLKWLAVSAKWKDT